MPTRPGRACAAVVFALGVAWAQQAPPEQSPVMFYTQTGLVLLPFHVAHGKNYVTNLSASDVILLEDGKPRPFTVFDSPDTLGRMPLELALLFDANPKIDIMWDPEDVFRFIPQWNEARSRTIFEKIKGDVRVSVYRCSEKTLQRLIPATSDPGRMLAGFRNILAPGFGTAEIRGEEIPLALPPQRDKVLHGPFTQDFPTSYFVSAERRGWPMEAAIATLNDLAAAQDKVSRVLVMFSEGIGATTTIPEDIGNHALDLGIPIYPIATNYQNHIQQSRFPRNYFRMQQFKALGKMTGGQAAEYTSINAAQLENILVSIRNNALAQYVVGFSPPSEAGPRKTHKLEIRLVAKSAGSVEGGNRRALY